MLEQLTALLEGKKIHTYDVQLRYWLAAVQE